MKKMGFCKDKFPVVLEFNNNEAIKTAVINGKGVSVLPLMAARYELGAGRLLEIGIEEITTLKYAIPLIYNGQSPLSAAIGPSR